MAILSLREAAEQAGTSKVDIWRAIRAGELAAKRTDDGDFAIDTAELFRVFETAAPPAGQEAAAEASEQASATPEAVATPETATTTATPEAIASPEEPAPEPAATPKPAPANDMADAFAALGAELLGLLAEKVTSDRPHRDEDEGRSSP